MKKIFYSMGVMLAAALTLDSCTEEFNRPVDAPATDNAFEIIASAVETRTVNDGMSTEWEAKDSINLFHAVAGTVDYVNDGKYTIAEADLETGRFTGTLNGSLTAETYDWYAFFPYKSFIESPANDKGYVYVGHGKGLNQKGYGNMGALARTVCPLYGVAKAVPAGQQPAIEMQHLTSVLAINVTNVTDSPLIVTTASFTAPEDIVGTYYIDFSDVPEYTPSGEDYVYETAKVNVSDGTELGNGESAVLYLAVKPFTAAAGSKLYLSVNGYEKELELKKDVTFHAGKIKTLTFSYDKVATAGTATFDFTANEWGLPVSTSAEGDGETGNITAPVVSGDVTMTVENGDASNETRLWQGSDYIDLRAYKGSSLSFSVPSGYVITKMTFTGTSAGISSLTGTYDSPIWSGSANPLVLEIRETVKIKTITVEYDLGEAEAPKTKQELSFPEASYSVVMGESFTAPALSGAKTAVTYSSSKEEVATVDNDGEVTLVGAGTTVITATAAADDTYAAGSASYTLIVSPAPSTDVLKLPWNEDFSGDLSAYTIGNGGGTTKLFNEALATGTAPEILIAKSGGFLTATIDPVGYTGALTLTFKSNYPSRIQVTSGTSGVEVSKVSDTEYLLNITTSVSKLDVTLTNTTGSNTRVDDISLIKGGALPEPPAGGGDLEAVDVTLDFTEQGYVNAQEVSSLTVDGVTVTLDKGSNSNTPKWYDKGDAVRVYGGGTFTISAGSNITGIKVYFATGDGTNEITADKGSFDGAVWTGSAKSIVFTVGGSTGHRRIQKIDVSTN